MSTLFLICAVLGGTVSVCQFLLGLSGLGGHHDLGGDGTDFDHGGELGGHELGDHDAGGHEGAEHDGDGGHDHEAGPESSSSWFIGVLSFRTVVAGMTFFGLAGLAADAGGAHPAGSLAVAVAAGVTALYAVAWTMRSLSRLKADGTVHIQNVLDERAVVYLTIPGHQTGKGKITVTVQDRTMEYEAVTDFESLPTGSTVQVVAIVDSETVAVESVPEHSRGSHV